MQTTTATKQSQQRPPKKPPMSAEQRHKLSLAGKAYWRKRKNATDPIGSGFGVVSNGSATPQDFSKCNVELLMAEIRATEQRLGRLRKALDGRLTELGLAKREGAAEPELPAAEVLGPPVAA